MASTPKKRGDARNRKPKLEILDVGDGDKVVGEAFSIPDAKKKLSELLGKNVSIYATRMASSRGDVLEGRYKLRRLGNKRASKASSMPVPKSKRRLKIKSRRKEDGPRIEVVRGLKEKAPVSDFTMSHLTNVGAATNLLVSNQNPNCCGVRLACHRHKAQARRMRRRTLARTSRRWNGFKSSSATVMNAAKGQESRVIEAGGTPFSNDRARGACSLRKAYPVWMLLWKHKLHCSKQMHRVTSKRSRYGIPGQTPMETPGRGSTINCCRRETDIRGQLDA